MVDLLEEAKKLNIEAYDAKENGDFKQAIRTWEEAIKTLKKARREAKGYDKSIIQKIDENIETINWNIQSTKHTSKGKTGTKPSMVTKKWAGNLGIILGLIALIFALISLIGHYQSLRPEFWYHLFFLISVQLQFWTYYLGLPGTILGLVSILKRNWSLSRGIASLVVCGSVMLLHIIGWFNFWFLFA